MAQARISMAKKIVVNTPFQVRVLIEHPMETGHRLDNNGAKVERNSLNRFVCSQGGEILFSAKLHPSMSVNPYLTFWLKLTASTPLTFRWEGDGGFVQEQTQPIEVTV